jgi:hypothetical protein
MPETSSAQASCRSLRSCSGCRQPFEQFETFYCATPPDAPVSNEAPT